ncbi:uncharacterized protein LOC115574547 isoform X2 [Sparus aurata]|uniref:uncharacterized protein LOC115574547 isoform X2 n=1 Tax=Sparus aurata TaxID=8175 RepID=UPI0011C130CC|nr:uncharacterized protein LOC115574547 isoform X2 [Sparus aurata]
MIIRREKEEGERQRIMMVQFKWIQMSLFVTAMLQFTGAAENLPASFTVTVGDDVTLPCENMIKPQQKCDSTIWKFKYSRNKSPVELVEHGQIGVNAKAKSDRLSVTENCSLVIKKVTVEDVGRYDCQQYKSDKHQGPDSEVDLSVVSMTQHKDTDVVTLTCSVATYEPCSHTVKWLYEGKEVDEDNQGVTTSQSPCNASVSALTYSYIYKSEFGFVKCSVTDGDKEQQLFPFRLQSSGNKPGAAENLPASFTVTVGDDVTLPCENVIKPQQQCDSTVWKFIDPGNKPAVELVVHGEIKKYVKAKLDRLQNCSLVIKKVTVEDVGRYNCQQYKSDIRQDPDSVVYLSVVSMTEHQNHDKVTLICSVSTYEPCSHTVKWLYEGKEVKKDDRGVTTSQSPCSASVRAPSSHHIYKSRFKYLDCSVTDGDKEQQLFPFRLQSSGNKPGDETTTTTTTTTSDNASTELRDWWWLLIILAVVLVALLIIVVKVFRRKRAEENNTRMEDNVGLTSNPAVTQSDPETSQGTAEPGDGVCYASVSYTRNTNRRDRAQGKDGDDDDDEAVTYTTIKASSLSAAASADPSDLYASVNKPKK